LEGNIGLRRNKYVAQCKSDPRAQLALTVKGISKEMALELVIGVVVSLAISGAARGTGLRPKWQLWVVRNGRRELISQKSVEADLPHLRN
jgi:hypothetical protein